MTATCVIAAEIHEFLRATHVSDPLFTVETDLIAAGHLDSLVVMDVVCFLEARYGIQMQPQDVNPDNLRSASRLASFVITTLQRNAA